MFYRETGQFRSSYLADQAIVPLKQDRILWGIALVFALVVPHVLTQYWITAILIPTLCLGLAALGLNIITGYAGQLSLGASAFMSVGGFATYNICIRIPDLPFPISIVLAGIITACFGVIIGLPSLRIKGFYLVIATLLAHFFVTWFFDAYPWFKNYNLQGEVKPPPFQMFGHAFTSHKELYYIVIAFVLPLTLLAKNIVRSSFGRDMMAVRDMDVAASVIGINVVKTKLLSFAISSFYCGVAGALYVYAYMQLLDTKTYSIELAFAVVFMIIVGGLGTILGSFVGAAVIFLFPIFMNTLLGSYGVDASQVQNTSKMIFGVLVIVLLVNEPNGIISLLSKLKEKLRMWPFPYRR